MDLIKAILTGDILPGIVKNGADSYVSILKFLTLR